MLGGVPTAFRPLRHRDFRLLWTGLAISLVGSGLWLVALAWQVIELGGGPTELSLVTALFTAGTLAGLALSLTVGLFGVHESLQTPLVPAALIVESTGVLVLVITAILAIRDPGQTQQRCT